MFLVLAVFVGLSCISAADVDGNHANASFINSTADFAGSIGADGSSSVNATVIEPCETADDVIKREG